MRLIVLFILTLMLASCNPCKRLARKCPPQVVTEIRDSIVYRDTVIYRDRIIYDSIPGDTIEVQKLIPVENKLNVSPITADSKYAEATAWVESSRLKLRLRQKEQVITHILDSADREVTHWKEMYHNKNETTIVKQRYVPKFYRVASWYGAGLTILLLLYIVVRKKIKWP